MSYCNLIELLQQRAESTPNRLAYSFLIDGEIGREIPIDYKTLAQRAQAIAAELQKKSTNWGSGFTALSTRN
ncbi:hypothetical protein [Thioflexithrix psekupsensis]|uniref:AMP-dependent synthetase/ligase domain-containing protein n=1 Tax=Thioflexithrix psekupsensis TaxID=1570016 RepID=A0A251X8Q9_9GAMM|nr:hypothetical protein [Thioflexithrix psekupsensis]OUD14320.1 hypothetical protein TPSD3_08340 [Thioflexithrix psekupsensis]